MEWNNISKTVADHFSKLMKNITLINIQDKLWTQIRMNTNKNTSRHVKVNCKKLYREEVSNQRKRNILLSKELQ